MLREEQMPYRKDSPTETWEKHDTDSSRQPIYIAVMGITGAGKSHFIRSMTKNDDIVVSGSQHSCTQQIGVWKFDLHGTPVTLLDTPGFDDSARSEIDILQELADWFDLSLKQGHKLAGIVYLHPIIINRMYRSAQQNTRLFRKLCGDTNMSNVVLATSQWANLPSEEIGELREEELLDADSFYRPLLDNGARYARYRDYESGIGILESLVHKTPFLTDLAQELGENKQLIDTAAGKAINADLAEAESKHKETIEKLRKELTDANERDRQEIMANIQAANDKCNALEAERDRLASTQRNQNRDMENRLNEMIRKQEAQSLELQANLLAVQAQHQQSQQDFNLYKAQVEADRQQQQRDDKWTKIATTFVLPIAMKFLKYEDPVSCVSNSFPSALEVPWTGATRLGIGFNGLTNQLAACAIEDMQLSCSRANPTINVVLSTVRTEEDKQRFINSSLNASATLFGVGAKTSVAQSHSFKYGERTMTAILECYVQHAPACYEKTPVLGQAAKHLLQTDPDNFTRVYGQYFVAGQVCKSSLRAVLTFSAESKEQIDEVAASLGVSKGPVAIDAAVSTMTKATKSRVAVECKLHSIGIPPNRLSTTPSASDIEAIFKNHGYMESEPQVAILQLYSTIDSAVALSAAGPEGTSTIQSALKGVSRIQSIYGNCQSVHAKRVLQAVAMLKEDISSIQPGSPGWELALNRNLTTLSDHKLRLEGCEIREELLQRVRRLAAQLTTPQEYDPKFTRWFNYGVVDAVSMFPSLSDEIHYKEEDIRVHGNATVQHIHREIFGGDKIIGFKVESMWDNDTNGAFTVEEGGVDHMRLKIRFKTRNCRGGHWKVHLYYVEGNAYIVD